MQQILKNPVNVSIAAVQVNAKVVDVVMLQRHREN